MSVVRSFPPVIAPDARALVLGSMPGKASLAAGQYYAHPRNSFWPIMGDLLGAGPDLPYDKRLAMLTRNGIALWDVLDSCTRESSLDSDIDDASAVPNDILGLLGEHPGISRIVFNGLKAETIFRKRVLSSVQSLGRPIAYLNVPSTSPANAQIAYEKKLLRWAWVFGDQSSVPVRWATGNS